MKASIIVTGYNYDRYVEECLLSCLGQETSVDFEIIFVDDGSTDRTGEIVRYYKPDLRSFDLPNVGVEQASNFAISEAHGEYIVRVDADDVLTPGYLEATAHELDNNPAAFVYSDYWEIDGLSHTTRVVYLPDYDPEELYRRGDFLATGTLYRKEALLSVGGYTDRAKNCGLENYELILRLMAAGYVGRCIHVPLFKYRVHQSSMSQSRRDQIIAYGHRLASEFGLAGYQTNANHPQGLVL